MNALDGSRVVPVAQPIGSSRFGVSALVGVPVFARSWQEAIPAPELPSEGGKPVQGQSSSGPVFSFFSLSSPVAVSKTDLGPHSPVRRLHREEVRAALVGLSERDHAVLGSFGVVPLLSGEQLERLHFREISLASRDRRRRDVLGRLVRLRILERLARRVGGVRAGSGGYVYGLGLIGERILQDGEMAPPDSRGELPRGLRRSRWRGGVSLVAHSLGVAEVYVRAVEAARAGQIEAVRFVSEPQCWQAVEPEDALSEPWTLKPDALLCFRSSGSEESWFVEIDRGTESPSTLTKKLAAYEAAWEAGLHVEGSMPRVWWVAVR